jgi:hypothetical protein
MHPEIARQLIARHHEDLAAMGRPRRLPSRHPAVGRPRPRLAPARPAPRRLALPRLSVPVWRLTWSRVATPAGNGRTWLIVISARRAHLGL